VNNIAIETRTTNYHFD